MYFPSILISISCVFLQIISKGSCGKCFVQFAFGLSDMTFVMHLMNHIHCALSFEVMLVAWLILLKILIQQRCLLSSWAWELLFERPRQIWKCGWIDLLYVWLFTYVIYRITNVARLPNVKLINRLARLCRGWFGRIFLFPNNSSFIESEIINGTKVICSYKLS